MGIFTIEVDRHHRAIAVRDGAVIGVLDPGRHRRTRRTRYEQVDVRLQLGNVAPQEILTADGISIKVTAVIGWRVVDPVAYTAVTDAPGQVYLAVQVGLRDEFGQRESGELGGPARREITAAVTAPVTTVAAGVGLAIDWVTIKDIVLPADLRAAYAEVITTRQRAQAQLEAARAETAALRSMANGARLLDDHPALARLRMIQAVPYGSKIVFEVPGDPIAKD